MAEPMKISTPVPSAVTVPTEFPCIANVPPHLKPIVRACRNLKTTDVQPDIIDKAESLKALLMGLSKQSKEPQMALVDVRRRGEFLGKQRMSNTERIAFNGWKCGSLIPPQLKNWPTGSESNADELPKWQKLATDLQMLYERENISPVDAQIWNTDGVVTDDMKALAIAVRKVRNGTRRAVANSQKSGKDSSVPGSSRRAVKKELRLLTTVISEMKNAKITRKARAQEELKAFSDVGEEALARKEILKTMLNEGNFVKDNDENSFKGETRKGSGKVLGQKATLVSFEEDPVGTTAADNQEMMVLDCGEAQENTKPDAHPADTTGDE